MDMIAELLAEIKEETGHSATVSFSWSSDGIKISVAWFTDDNRCRMHFENASHEAIRKYGLGSAFAALANAASF